MSTRILDEAMEIQDEIFRNRRYIHQNAEVGLELPKTVAYVKEQLESYGYEPQEMGGGVVCLLGQGSPVLMLRADMDALPQEEVTGLDYACKDGACHSCGHDAHTAIMLGVAKLLKAHESELKGTVKILFQPGEETLYGGANMVKAGVMENPHVDAAVALHIAFGPCGPYNMTPGYMVSMNAMSSADCFKITVKGKACHGSMPFTGVSPLVSAADVIRAIVDIPVQKVAAYDPAVISVGEVHGGSAVNIIPDTCEIGGNIRTFNAKTRELCKDELVRTAEAAAAVNGATVQVEFFDGVGAINNDPELNRELVEYSAEVCKGFTAADKVMSSDDFSAYGDCGIPLAYAYLCCGGPAQGVMGINHNPSAVYDESALPYGTAALVNFSLKWLEKHSC
jgi:amidohydrolase